MAFPQGAIDNIQQRQSRFTNGQSDHAAIGGGTVPDNPFALLQLVNHAGDTRCPRHQTFRQNQGGQVTRVFLTQ